MPSPPRVRRRFVLRFCVPFGETDRSRMTSSVCRRSHLSLSLSLFCKVCARPRVCFPREDEDDLLRRRRQKRVVSKNRFRFYLELTKSVPSFSFPPSLLGVLWFCFQSIYRYLLQLARRPWQIRKPSLLEATRTLYRPFGRRCCKNYWSACTLPRPTRSTNTKRCEV